ncbi:hypothetical protein AB1Y20_022402 [Prymnesium parvum]|uniref:Trichome birefringence-like C-terminal domain-containing protein n=1 Tax=Prymnesium parvum TaxID=97485 RepID=A0AB34JIV2_PRYPA
MALASPSPPPLAPAGLPLPILSTASPMRCRMLAFDDYHATSAHARPRCRLRLLLNHSTVGGCAAACAAQPYCEAATHVAPERGSPHGPCHARAGGSPATFGRAPRGEGKTTALYRRCESCGLQARLDAACAANGARTPACAPFVVARNRRVLHRKGRGLDDFEWECVERAPAEDFALACVDDRGAMSPCRVAHNTSATRNRGCRLTSSLHDLHRAGCAPPACLNTPGGMRSERTRLAANASRHATHRGARRKAGAAQAAEWALRSRNETAAAIARLAESGYMQCAEQHDELHDDCRRRRPARDWLRYAWRATAARPRRHAARPALSWWLDADEARDADAFDADAFVAALERIGAGREARRGGAHRPRPRREARAVVFVGDSTARQQAVSLCCLLQAAANRGASFKFRGMSSQPYMQVRCSLTSHDGAPLADVSYARIGRADELDPWRPSQHTPSLSPMLAAAIARAPTLLLVQLGPWDFEDGCADLHSLHDSLCNNSRPWLLDEFAKRWSLIAAAIDETYSRADRRARSLVVLRAETPRDFDGGTWREGGTCSREAPYERLTGLTAASRGGLDEWTGLDPSSMRFVVVAKNLVMDAVALQRLPWASVLDAYQIARLRPDAHPGPRRSIHNKHDCLHYCLPGLPDLLNGRLLALMHEHLAQEPQPPASEGEMPMPAHVVRSSSRPGRMIDRWNFDYEGKPFVQGAPPLLALRSRTTGEPTIIECPVLNSNPDGQVPLLGVCSDML